MRGVKGRAGLEAPWTLTRILLFSRQPKYFVYRREREGGKGEASLDLDPLNSYASFMLML